MNNIFNSDFELSMRFLLLLNCFAPLGLSESRLINIDLICTYIGDFIQVEKNLHGNNNLRYAELYAKKKMVKQAMKLLIIKEFVDLEFKEEGFIYTITHRGAQFCMTLNDEYVDEYYIAANIAKKKYGDISDRALSALINKMAVNNIVGDIDGQYIY